VLLDAPAMNQEDYQSHSQNQPENVALTMKNDKLCKQETRE
jgi:hypothetical protein